MEWFYYRIRLFVSLEPGDPKGKKGIKRESMLDTETYMAGLNMFL
jgi:hypothetical protein